MALTNGRFVSGPGTVFTLHGSKTHVTVASRPRCVHHACHPIERVETEREINSRMWTIRTNHFPLGLGRRLSLLPPPRHIAQRRSQLDFSFPGSVGHIQADFQIVSEHFERSIHGLHAQTAWACFDFVDVKLNFTFGVVSLHARYVSNPDATMLKRFRLK